MAGGHHVDPAFLAKLAHRTELNHKAMVTFAACIGILMGVVALLRLVKFLPQRVLVSINRLAVVRMSRSYLTRKAPCLPSLGHLLFILTYLALNIIITFTNLDNHNLPLHSNISSRTGWMAIANVLLVILLSLKNNPLGILTSFSHDRLNIFHRVTGFTTVAFVIVHGCAYTSYFAHVNFLSRLTEVEEIYGMLAGFAFLIMAIAGGLVRRWWYELFYYLHTTFWIIAIVMTGLHQPKPAKKILFLACAAAALYLLDRLLRLLHLTTTTTTVTLTPLPLGGTRVALTKPPPSLLFSKPGKHCFLWIPRLRIAETHPFTIAASQPLEFVVASHDGFTRALHAHAARRPGAVLRAAVDGAYGAFLEPLDRDKVVLVAGGSGASFTVGVAVDMLRKMGDADKAIDFIWLVKDAGYVVWFDEQLRMLSREPRVSIRIFVTRSSTAKDVSATSSTTQSASTLPDPEKGALPKLFIPVTAIVPDEKPTPLSPSTVESLEVVEDIPIIHERPDIAALVRASIGETPRDKNVLAMCCGPERLMTVVRNTTAECMRSDGPRVELHCEHFGW